MQYLPIYKKSIIFIALLLALAFATPVLADYLGPNRTVTKTVSSCKVVLYECRLVPSKNMYKYKRADSWSCSNESKPWQQYPKNPSGDCNENNHPKYWSREEGTETVTTTMPEATITGTVNNCTLQNGWCNSTTAPQFDLVANEPVAGYSISLIEGTLNGNSFACPSGATSCTLPFLEGDNNYNFWAISTWGDSSRMGGVGAWVDTVSPDVGIDISGVSGTNGWFVSATTVTATGSDATSGIASTVLSIDNTTWQPSLTLNEGVYNVMAVATDNAGNRTPSQTTPVGVDTTTPSINLAVNGTLGHNNWYKTTPQVSATPSDQTSGIASFEVAVDGGGYQVYAPTAFGDGLHSIQFRAIDKAGNQTETDLQSFAVDTKPPTVDLPRSWVLGRSVEYSVSDEGSGLAAIRIVIEDEDERYAKMTWDASVSGQHHAKHIDWNGEFRDGTVAPPGTYLVWVKAQDKAGNERFELGKIIVPEPNAVLSLLPTEAPLAVLSTPPAELLDVNTEVDIPAPALGFGGSTVQGGQPTTQSLILTTGSAGAVSTTTTPGVLWGSVAAAVAGVITTYVLSVAEKRKEEEEAQAAEVRAQIAEDKERWAEHGMTKEEKQEAKAQQAEEHDAKVQERKEKEEWGNLSAEEKAQLKWEEERDAAYAQEVWENWLEEQYGGKTLTDSTVADGGLDGNIWTSDEGAPAQNAVDKWVLDSHIVGTVSVTGEGTAVQGTGSVGGKSGGTAGQNTGGVSTSTNPPSLVDRFTGWLNSTIIDPLKDKTQQTLSDLNTFIQDKIITPAENSPFVQKVVLPLGLAGLVLTNPVFGIQYYQQAAQDPHLFDAANSNALNEWFQLTNLHPLTDEKNSDAGYLLTHPYEAFVLGYDATKAGFNSLAGYVDAIWQVNPASDALSSTLEYIGDSVCQGLGDGWDRRCGAVFYFGSSVAQNPADTLVAIGTKLIADPLAGFWKTTFFLEEHYNPSQISSDLSQAIQEHGLLEGLKQYGGEQWQFIKDTVSSDPQVQSFLVLAGFLALASIPVFGTALAAGLGAILVGKQTIDLLAAIDQQLQAAPTYQDAMNVASSKEVRRNLAVTITMIALLGIGVFKGVKEITDFRAFQDSLSPSAQTSFYDMPFPKRLSAYVEMRSLGLTPSEFEYYLNEVTRPGSPLASLPVTEALQLSQLAVETGKGAFLMDYVSRYGYTDALKLASPEVIKGMTNDQFLVQAQDILSKDAGYNVTPENVFTTYPGSTIGKNSTFITNEAAISDIIGDFHGTKTIYVTPDQAVALAQALGVEPASLVDGFRISKISNLDSLNLAYPTNTSTGINPLFLGPGKGLPGGGTEITINPPVPMDSLNVVDQIIIHVYP